MKTFSITDIGQKRSMNQDFLFTSEIPVGKLPNLFIVADGMGGHNAGEFASECAVLTIVETVKQSLLEEPVSILKEAIEKANHTLLEKAREDTFLAGMGTTVVLCTISGEHMDVANVGDSRLYTIDHGITQVTRDHSLVQEMVRLGEMDQETAKEHPDKNIITRAIGAVDHVEIDFFEVNLKKDDYILLCSDGLSNMVEDDEIRRIVLGQRDIAEKAEKLVETANGNGGRDNISVVVIEPFSDEVKAC